MWPTSVVLELCLLACHDACNAAKHLRSLQRRRNVVLVALGLPHVYPNLQRAVDLAVLHEISPCDPRIVVIGGPEVALLDIFGQVQLNVAECYALAPACARVFLYDLELEGALLQHAILVHGEPHGQGDVVVVLYFVVAYRATFCATAVLCSRRVREVPFDKGSAVDERDVVEVDYLASISPPVCARARSSNSLAGATQTLATHLSALRRPQRTR
jgi:hypothetical protein